MPDARPPLVLLIDDDPPLRRLARRFLETAGHAVIEAADGDAGLAALRQSMPELVLVDLHLVGMSGMEVLRRIRELHPHLPLLMLTADGAVDRVVDAMKAGATDYLTKPVERERLVSAVKTHVERARALQEQRARAREASGAPAFGAIVGRSPPMLALLRRLERVAAVDVTVLITGESGTGKELVAQALHAASGRATGPFVALNCGAVAEAHQAEELFGLEPGARPGAAQGRPGRFEEAHGGTLFLDEVAELSPGLQAALLRVLETRQVRRVGGSRDIPVDARVISATHQDLLQTEGFRTDLYYRLAVYPLEVPPLRDRPDDIPLLIEHFTVQACARHGLPTPRLPADALRRAAAYDWPGNVRQLANAVSSAAIDAEGGELRLDLPGQAPAAAAPPAPAAPRTLEDLQRTAIIDAMRAADGNLSEVCRTLEIPRSTLYRRMRRLGLR